MHFPIPHHRVVAAALMLVVTVPAGAMANGEASVTPTRPTFTDTANTVQTGYLELELGAHALDNDQYGTPFVLKLGVTDDFDFKFGGEGLQMSAAGPDDTVGFGDLGFFAKYRFRRSEGMLPAVSCLASLVVPSASDDAISGNSTNLAFLALLSGAAGPISYDFNAGLDIVGVDQDSQVFDLPIILALSGSVHGPLGAILEWAEFVPLSDQGNRMHLLAALTYALRSSLSIDVAFVKGLENAPDWEVHAGVTASLVKLW